MAFRFTQRQVADSRAQENFDQLASVLATTVAPATSSAVQGPSTVGTDLVYTAIDLVLKPGTWLVYGQATLVSQTAADGKQLGLFNVTANADVPNSKGPAGGAATTNAPEPYTTMTVVTLATESTLRLKGFRNGASQIQIGFGFVFTAMQRMLAVRMS